jgi:biopolymer transport protein ExbB/TolQ
VSFATLLQKFFMGIGVSWVLYALSGLSVLSLAIIGERWLFYRRRRVAPDAALRLARGGAVDGPRDAIEQRVADRLLVIAREAATRRDAENALDMELRRQRQRYEAGLTFLATLGNNAPFVGLLGTVLGIMAAFWQLSAIADAARKNELLMSSISEALIATAMGLVVAIPAVAFYNVFRKRVNGAFEQAREIAASRLTAHFGTSHGRDL